METIVTVYGPVRSATGDKTVTLEWSGGRHCRRAHRRRRRVVPASGAPPLRRRGDSSERQGLDRRRARGVRGSGSGGSIAVVGSCRTGRVCGAGRHEPRVRTSHISAGNIRQDMSAELSRTHHLECEDFAAEFRALLELVLPDTTAAVVRVREEEMGMDPDGDDCRRVWDGVRDRLERLPETDRNGTTAWRVPTTTEAGRAVLSSWRRLWTSSSAHFVFQLECHAGGTPVLEAIPITRMQESMRRCSERRCSPVKSSA